MQLSDRLILTDEQRYEWLQANDAYLLSELSNIFGEHLFVRGNLVDKFKRTTALAAQQFRLHPEVDYFIYSDSAPTKCDLTYVAESRIIFYRPGKSWNRGRDGRSHCRAASCRFVRLKKQILTIFDEELYAISK